MPSNERFGSGHEDYEGAGMYLRWLRPFCANLRHLTIPSYRNRSSIELWRTPMGTSHINYSPRLSFTAISISGAQITLGGLDGRVAEHEFDLLEIPATLPAQLGAGTAEIVSAEVLDAICFDDCSTTNQTAQSLKCHDWSSRSWRPTGAIGHLQCRPPSSRR
jgi:hypothetical protein